MQRTKLESALLGSAGDLDEASELLSIELRFLGEPHEGALDIEPQGRHLFEPRQGSMVRDAHAAHPGIEIHVDASPTACLPCGSGHPLPRVVGPQDEVDVTSHELRAVRLGEQPHEQDRLADSGVAQRDGGLRLDHREPHDLRKGLDGGRDRDQAQSVGIVLDHGHDGAPPGQSGDHAHVEPEGRRIDLQPRIEPLRRVGHLGGHGGE